MLYLTVLTGCLAFYIFYRYWLSWMVLLLVILVPVFSTLVSLPAMLTTRVGIKIPKTAFLEEPAEAEEAAAVEETVSAVISSDDGSVCPWGRITVVCR